MTYEQAGRLVDVAHALGLRAWRRNRLGILDWGPGLTHFVELPVHAPSVVRWLEQQQRRQELEAEANAWWDEVRSAETPAVA